MSQTYTIKLNNKLYNEYQQFIILVIFANILWCVWDPSHGAAWWDLVKVKVKVREPKPIHLQKWGPTTLKSYVTSLFPFFCFFLIVVLRGTANHQHRVSKEFLSTVRFLGFRIGQSENQHVQRGGNVDASGPVAIKAH